MVFNCAAICRSITKAYLKIVMKTQKRKPRAYLSTAEATANLGCGQPQVAMLCEAGKIRRRLTPPNRSPTYPVASNLALKQARIR